MTDVYLGLGANEGDPLRQLQLAVEELDRVLILDAVSSVYRTEPVGPVPQPDYLNLVCRGRTEAPIHALHERLMRIEERVGRTRDRTRNAPRRIDIDLLAYGEVILETADLVVPHPRLHERGFVLVPMLEIAPDWRHPATGRTVRDHLAELEDPKRVTRMGPLVESRYE